jgi:tetratricopeptide (TPR) repeat protein
VAWLYLSQTYERQPERAVEAAEQLDRALAANDLTPAVEAGILLYRAGRSPRDSADAMADVRRSLEIHPYAEAFIDLAAEHLRQQPVTAEDYWAVIECCDYALASPAYSPNEDKIGQTHYLRAHALAELGQYEEAAQAVDRFLAAGGPPTAEIHRLRALMRVRQTDYPNAMRFFQDSLALDRDTRSASATLVERGNVYLAIGANDLALADFQAALKLQKDNVSALAGRGLVRAMQRNIGGAEEDAEQAWAIGPPSPRVAWLAARTLAVIHTGLRSRGSFVSVQESKDMVRYRKRAMALVEQALILTPPNEQKAFWRNAVQRDPWLSQLSDQDPKYLELQQKYGPATAAPTTEL